MKVHGRDLRRCGCIYAYICLRFHFRCACVRVWITVLCIRTEAISTGTQTTFPRCASESQNFTLAYYISLWHTAHPSATRSCLNLCINCMYMTPTISIYLDYQRMIPCFIIFISSVPSLAFVWVIFNLTT